ncbi:DUF4239 domain-containing protein [Mesorhizobium sp. AR10]|uniref:bestrophin-like domain n=1 Tax=Mesorhizobium sp. AR10 TaxID=2865839 RepID=UPI0021605E47|nr:DUF4239 domain-containing protein [Mesorhizobium sp. AR10]UVK37897.1 DUF4239 domain-containing protein [Mesorhizobium sp. AR10]
MAIFVCLAAASLASLAIYDRLPSHHRQDDTNTVVRLVANLFVVMTSLVLGLMINSAKNTFESIDHNIHAYATELILFDRSLRQYGPETDGARQPLIAYVQRVVDATSPSQQTPVVANRLSELLLNEIGNRLTALTPPDAEHTALLQDARQHFRKVIELRWVLIEQSEGTIPGPLILMLVTWLVLIFASFGYRAPRNAVIVGTFVLSAALIAGALYLIMDMDVPFTGPIQISPAPLERALAELKQP